MKTAKAVAEAAAAPDPRPARVANSAAPANTRRTPDVAAIRGAGRSVWGPLATFSGALWLRVTGLFFGVVALTLLRGAWRLRGAVRAGGDPTPLRHFWMFAVLGLLFGYFAVSGFVRARLRERRAH